MQRWQPLHLCWLLAALTIAAIAAAWLIEGLGYKPCPLCLYQRYPYYLAIAVLLLAAVFGRPRLGLALACALFLIDAGLALYHSGIELGMVALPASCTVISRAQSLAELRAQLLSAVPSCDQPALRILGLSLANWNALFALGLAVLAALGLRGERKAHMPLAA